MGASETGGPVMNETRVYGPPGVGKTTWLTKQIEAGVDAVGADKVMVSSFSKAAALELASRNVAADRSNIGTLHSICYRALNAPEIAETHVDDWNKNYPHFHVNSKSTQLAIDTGEYGGNSSDTDYLMAYNLLRSRGKSMCDKLLDAGERSRMGAVSGHVLMDFIGKWEDWKTANNLFDFTDLLVMATEDFKEAPGQPRIGFFDEVQDFNPLMMELIRQWGEHLDRTILVGDDDQTIYSFMGSTPEAFLDGVPTQEIVLSHSWRLPEAIRSWSNTWVKRISRRKNKDFTARGEGGEVCHIWQANPNATYKNRSEIARHIIKDLEAGLSVMVLASCSYMLADTIATLRAQGIPFRNQYRPSNGTWNPLPVGSDKRVPSWRRLAAFLSFMPELEGREGWTYSDFYLWREVVSKRACGIVPGALGKEWVGVRRSDEISIGDIFEGANERPPFGGDVDAALEWFRGALPDSKRGTFDYPIRCVKSGNAGGLAEPRVCVGTIHSVKGGEADSVYVIPDLSPEGVRNGQTKKGADAMYRLFYVAGTRARQKLSLMGPVSRSASVIW
jgi:DNA helicase-2/ATP-dependent DNA helicase PcrA